MSCLLWDKQHDDYISQLMGLMPSATVWRSCTPPPPPSLPVPSGVERTNVGSIFTEAVRLVSLPRPLSISLRKRLETSIRFSLDRRRWYRNLSTWKTGGGVHWWAAPFCNLRQGLNKVSSTQGLVSLVVHWEMFNRYSQCLTVRFSQRPRLLH